ncbi:hypothetical protein BAUCODRAFT_63832 [Baudoinia panamericana UAMH 10762]|uniref:DUF1275 domain protein n=1 Tax=Baudoinia panamericana (strain UAMH 10762) TaxID=717646 RepID=M2NKU0_BAUPA|nr:uncharacterized protein BAUCODRAFT_63832 [Baudoinia panamericana UAMH 10762]EMD00065.1 hypothetical protein BAUCODRAFT_63832 [Baudoinia panamericana UAMH 10762]
MAQNNTYGTVSGGARHGNGLLNGADAERAALLGKPDGHDSLTAKLGRHMTRDISKSWGDLMLLGCYIITGLLDSSSVQVWGSFVSMQTGNTVYLGLGLAAPYASTRWIRAGISVSCFCLGSAFFARYHRYFGQRKRWVMVSAYTLQLLMILAAALMATLGPQTGPSGGVTVWVAVPIALIAFQSAGQAVTSRVLSYGGLTSVVLTSIYCDLFSDQKLFSAFTENVERNRRAAAPLMVLVGALAGGLWAHSEWGMAGALWTGVVLKAMVTVGWLLWKADPDI